MRIWSRATVESAEIYGSRGGYQPTASAAKAHQSDARFIGVSGGWRAGKSLLSGMEALAWIPFAKLIWIIAIDYDMTRQEFQYCAEGAISVGLATASNVHFSSSSYVPSRMVCINGCVVETRTLANATDKGMKKIASRPPDVVIVCEPGQIDGLKDHILPRLMGRVSQRKGLILMAGTSDETSDDWFNLWDSWNEKNVEGGQAFSIPTWENFHAYPGGANDREFLVYREKYGEEALMSHYGGIPADPSGLVLKGYWNKKVHILRDGRADFDPEYPVEVAIDPNYGPKNAYSVEAIQWDVSMERKPAIWICDEIAYPGMTHDEIKELAMIRPWWPFVRGGTIDPYAAEQHVFGAPAPVSYWSPPLELRYSSRPKVNSTVQALKQVMRSEGGSPVFGVNPKAERFAWEAGHWKGEKNGKPTDENCDAMKATGYWLVDHYANQRGSGADDNPVAAITSFAYDGGVTYDERLDEAFEYDDEDGTYRVRRTRRWY